MHGESRCYTRQAAIVESNVIFETGDRTHACAKLYVYAEPLSSVQTAIRTSQPPHAVHSGYHDENREYYILSSSG